MPTSMDSMLAKGSGSVRSFEAHEDKRMDLWPLIEQLNHAPPASDEWSRFFEQLVELVEHHAEEDEQDIVPKAQKACPAKQPVLAG